MPTIDVEPYLDTLIAGDFNATIKDPAGYQPSNVIRINDPFSIECTWNITGNTVPNTGGNWYVEAVFESIGPGEDFRTTAIPAPLNGLLSTYTVPIPISAGACFPDGTTLKVPADKRSQAYHVTALLTYADVAGNPGPMAASVDLGELTLFM